MPTVVVGNERMSRLCESFPTLRNKPGARPWNQFEFARAASGPSRTSGSSQAAAFVLSVWNGGTIELGPQPRTWFQQRPYRLPVFDAVRAMGVWDDEHQQAFIAWCARPFWP